MARADRSELEHSAARTLAAVVGTVPLALSGAVALALSLPLPLVHRLVVGGYSTLPLWMTASLWVFLARNGKSAWLRVAVCTAAAAFVSLAAAIRRGAP